MTYEETVSEHLRITILRFLADDNDYTVNESLLADLVEDYGFKPSFDKMRTELGWLEEQGLIELAGKGCMVAKLTRRGLDVAKGRASVHGVYHPFL